MLAASRRLVAALVGHSRVHLSPATCSSVQKLGRVSTSSSLSEEEDNTQQEYNPDGQASQVSEQEQQQQASPHVLPPEEEDFIWDEAEEAEVMAVLDEDIKEFEEELAERPAVTPAEIKALWQEAVKHQEEVDRPHLEAQLDRGVLDFDMDEPRTISHAGPAKAAWGIGSLDEEGNVDSYEFDAIGGAVHENEKNALLSDSAKEIMFDWSKQGWSVPELAVHFRIRQQRVMAILALKEMEREEEERTGEPLDPEIQWMMEGGPGLRPDGSDNFHGLWDCDEASGVGERHVKMMPRAPHYEFGSDLEQRPDKALDRRRDLPVEQLEWELGIKEEEQAVKEFKQNLEYNIGKRAPELSRESLRVNAPKRPKQGWSLVVKPAKGAHASQTAYVAKPEGNIRELTPSERVYLARMKPRPRRRLL